MSRIDQLTEQAVVADADLFPIWSDANDQPRSVTALSLSNYILANKLATWALTQAFRLASAIRNADGAITTANIVWPDGVTGTYTADTISTAFPGSTDAWHATYNGTPVKTITQPAVTRDATTGAVTVQPAITIV